jgi:hypothetical protein
VSDRKTNAGHQATALRSEHLVSLPDATYYSIAVGACQTTGHGFVGFPVLDGTAVPTFFPARAQQHLTLAHSFYIMFAMDARSVRRASAAAWHLNHPIPAQALAPQPQDPMPADARSVGRCNGVAWRMQGLLSFYALVPEPPEPTPVDAGARRPQPAAQVASATGAEHRYCSDIKFFQL